MRRNEFWNEELETLGLAAMAEFHEEFFLRTVGRVAAHSPLYRRKFHEADVDPSRIRTLGDLSRLPFTEKKELREAQLRNAPVGLHRACAPEQVARIYSSSGTTGIPTYVGLTHNDIQNVHAEAIARFCWAGGIRPGSVVANIPTAPFIADTFREGIEKTGATHLPTGFNTDRVLSAFRHQGANALHSTVSFWSYFLEEIEKAGIDPRDLGVRRILGGAEGGTRTARPRVEEAFGATVTEGMGMGEMACVVFGECVRERGSGMHYLAQGLVHVELIDPETGEAKEIEEGAQGELVYTALQHEAMPLLRYRSGDNVRVVSTKKCSCGRPGFRIQVLGRTDDMITVLGVNVYPIAVREVVAAFAPRVTGEIEIQLEKPGPVAEPPVWVKVELGEEPGAKDELKRLLENALRDKLVFRARVELVDALPKYQYKRKLVNKRYA
ncbi:MAG: phenylacetate--CoA ligase family protein [Deltaproteobacteria bacterium]|nr:phenylacetate--CoA ligase family protein [Deltaproteobacteria bacterium]